MLRGLALSLARGSGGDREDAALRSSLAADLQRWLARDAGAPAAAPSAPPDLPPGPPIGGWSDADECEWAGER